MEQTYSYLWLIHVEVWRKPRQYCEAIHLQLKIDEFNKNIFKKKSKMTYNIGRLYLMIFPVWCMVLIFLQVGSLRIITLCDIHRNSAVSGKMSLQSQAVSLVQWADAPTHHVPNAQHKSWAFAPFLHLARFCTYLIPEPLALCPGFFFFFLLNLTLNMTCNLLLCVTLSTLLRFFFFNLPQGQLTSNYLIAGAQKI